MLVTRSWRFRIGIESLTQPPCCAQARCRCDLGRRPPPACRNGDPSPEPLPIPSGAV